MTPRRSGGTPFRSILHINEKGGRFGGTEEYIDRLTVRLRGEGVQSHLVCGVDGAAAHELDSVRVVPGLASRSPVWGTAEGVADAVRDLDPDVIFVHNVFDARVIEALDAAGRRATLLWYIHDHYVTCLTELRIRHGAPCSDVLGTGCLDAIEAGACTRRLAGRELTGSVLAEQSALLAASGHVDALIVVSAYMRDTLARNSPQSAGRIHLVTRPVRPPVPRRSASISATTSVTFAGRITPEKGLDVVLEALALVPRGLPICLRIAGVVEHDDHWAHCQALAARAMEANPDVEVRYDGHLDYAAVDALLAASDIVVAPSRWPEPLGAVAVEAQRAGAAVIASDVGGLASCVIDGRTGVLVAAGDVTGWARALTALARDPQTRTRLGAAGAAAAGSATMERHVSELVHIIGGGRAAQPSDTEGYA